ncbi:hypothetical protein FRB93_001975 [Tulasnella sp. JGI-2019a]|nr:hypothetical protein FRB93_001975 [Tulasnella sp. JGI-2019a]
MWRSLQITHQLPQRQSKPIFSLCILRRHCWPLLAALRPVRDHSLLYTQYGFSLSTDNMIRATALVMMMLASISIATVTNDVTVYMNDSRISYTVSDSPVSFQTFISPGNPGYWWPGDDVCGSNLGVSDMTSSASLTFTGTSITINEILVYKTGGPFHVYLDGNLVQEANNSSPNPVDEYNTAWALGQGGNAFAAGGCNPAPAITLGGLKYGEHTVMLQFWDANAIPVIRSLVYDSTKPPFSSGIIVAILVGLAVIVLMVAAFFIQRHRTARHALPPRTGPGLLTETEPGYPSKPLYGDDHSYSDVNKSHPSSIHLATLTSSTRDAYLPLNTHIRRPSSPGSSLTSAKTAGSNPFSQRDVQYPPPSRSRFPSTSTASTFSHSQKSTIVPYSIPYSAPRRPSSPQSLTSLQTGTTSPSEFGGRSGYHATHRPRFASASLQGYGPPTPLSALSSLPSPLGSEASGHVRNGSNTAILERLLERGLPNEEIRAAIRIMAVDAGTEFSSPSLLSANAPSPTASTTSHGRRRQRPAELPLERPTTDRVPQSLSPPSSQNAQSQSRTAPRPLSSPGGPQPTSPAPTYHTTWRPATSPTPTSYVNPPPRYSFAGALL